MRQSVVEIFDFNPLESRIGSGTCLKEKRTFRSIPLIESFFFCGMNSHYSFPLICDKIVRKRVYFIAKKLLTGITED